MLCLYTAGCAGFTSDGFLKSAATRVRKVRQDIDLYVKTRGAPAATHYLRIEKWDADFEDLPGRKMHTKDLPTLEAACSKNPACAGVTCPLHALQRCAAVAPRSPR